MKLSNKYLPYTENTIIFVCDRSQAKVFRAHDRDFEEIEEVKNERLSLEDSERYTVQVNDTRSAKGQDDQLKEREARTFYSELAEKLSSLKKTLDYKKLILVVPADDKRVLADKLNNKVLSTLESVFAKQLTKTTDEELVKRLDEHRRSFDAN